ncbi:3-(cis-5,6-dihydroxycyclohexa-1,3-dien-1-yl)propanoate dehydrogenase [Pusillimonas sp. DMV24BSW_D]|uniref:3-(cis-5,6-dihydroxycyclohexa-1, 3-dien-1-yl)propanoate dehydrogenase n=1 Tax=Neopusillimonas aestuarii TaxID=2716226 RepID=UPI00140D19FA|nr:3-(cis-5,6-dihydroxycyclohexa-1,3-dien-1-yl)propanoate dehydrogenase [Pusillimonas sp. DMV24BSW_D]QIM47909.1 3-(cis-5,6-dihydroxycyclohexa-1,3-dien-1-yl)propanoate dehydrogenase [Pusillimonas sp. DMV24BSW_D]
MGWLDGDVALITGAGTGIGRAILDRYFEEGCAGVGVLLRDRSQGDGLLRDYGNRVCITYGDVRSYESNENAVNRTLEQFGKIDTVVGNAGVWDSFGRLERMSPQQINDGFSEIFDVNVKAYILLAKAAVSALRQTQGSFIFTLSNSSFYAGGGGVLYVASKHACVGMIKQLAYELAPEIRVNGVAPGGTVTALRGPESLGRGDQRLNEIPGIKEKIADSMPLRFIAAPEDHAGHYVLLASKRNSSATTAAIIQSDCGWEIRPVGAGR